VRQRTDDATGRRYGSLHLPAGSNGIVGVVLVVVIVLFLLGRSKPVR
jgi:hypothetical protein